MPSVVCFWSSEIWTHPRVYSICSLTVSVFITDPDRWVWLIDWRTLWTLFPPRSVEKRPQWSQAPVSLAVSECVWSKKELCSRAWGHLHALLQKFSADIRRDLRIVFFVRIESSNRIGRIYHASRNTAWWTAGVPYRPIICWRLALWTNESDVRNWVLVHFNSVLKRVKQCRCTLI